MKSLTIKRDNCAFYRSIREMIEDIKSLHRYTERLIKKIVCLPVLLVGAVVSFGIISKDDLQRIAEW